MKSRSRSLIILIALTISLATSSARAYIEVPYTLGRVVTEANFVLLMQVEKVDKERGLIIYRKLNDLKGSFPTEVIKHNIGKNGFHPREWQTIMAWAEPGKTAVFLHNGGASETCIDNYWYQAYAGGEWWNMSHAEPFLLRSFAGRPDKLATAVTALVGGQEVIVPCMTDGDKNALHLRTAKVQRCKASLKLMDYDPKRDFVGWGGEDFRVVGGMPGFSHYGALGRTDPDPRGIAPVDLNGDGKLELCLFGLGRTALMQFEGSALADVSLPYNGGARAASWADYNGDGKPDLLLATPSGPKLLSNQGTAFRDDSAGLPPEVYASSLAATWLDYDLDGRPDALVADTFRGLRLYRNIVTPQMLTQLVEPKWSQWQVAGPFDNTGNRGFDAAYPPEQGVDLASQYIGKNNAAIKWQPRDFADGAVNSLAIFPDNNEVVAYLYREITTPGAVEIPLSLGSDDTLTVWLNGEKLLAENVQRGCAPDQHQLKIKLRPGKNVMLMKIGQGSGEFAFYFKAGTPGFVLPQLFEDVSDRVGLGTGGITGNLKTQHIVVADMNGDKRPDVLAGAGNGVLLLNTAQGFVESKTSGLDYRATKATPAVGDFDADGLPDVFVPEATGGMLYRNLGGGKFSNVTTTSGDLAAGVPHATSATWADFNGDGKLDLFVGCAQGANRYFRNAGGGKFVDAGDEIGLYQKVFNTAGLLVADVNKDGALDLVMNNEGQDSAILLGAGKAAAMAENKAK